MSSYLFDPTQISAVEVINRRSQSQPQSHRGSSKPSPRRNVFKMSQPPLPKNYVLQGLAEQGFGNAEYAASLKSAKILNKIHDFTRPINEAIAEINENTDLRLKELYRQEQDSHYYQENSSSSSPSTFLRYQQQIQVLDEAMRKLCQVTRPHSIDQANFIWKVWSSAGELYSGVFQSMSQTIDELTLRLSEKTITSKNWEDKYTSMYQKYQRLTENAQHLDHDVETQQQLKQYEEEIFLKDKEILQMQTMITNMTLWFPNFTSFGNSILSRFLPPISHEQIEQNQQHLLSIPKNEIEPQMKLAKDYLLDDLKRIEELNIGFTIHMSGNATNLSTNPTQTDASKLPVSNTPMTTTDTVIVEGTATNTPIPTTRQKRAPSTRRLSTGIPMATVSREDLKSLNQGLFLNSAMSSSFSVATENEYNLRQTTGRTDSSDYVEAISTLADQITKQHQHPPISSTPQTPKFRKGKSQKRMLTESSDPAVVANIELLSAAGTLGDQYLMALKTIEELKQKLQLVLQEAQVLESQNQTLQSTTKRQILSLENETKLAAKREKQLIFQLRKAQNESHSILTCLPTVFHVPRSLLSAYTASTIQPYFIPIDVLTSGHQLLLSSSDSLFDQTGGEGGGKDDPFQAALSYNVVEILRKFEELCQQSNINLSSFLSNSTSFTSASFSKQLSGINAALLLSDDFYTIDELEVTMNQILQDILGCSHHHVDLSHLATEGLDPMDNTKTPFPIESMQWKYDMFSNLLNGQAKHFFTISPMNIHLTYALADESIDPFIFYREELEESIEKPQSTNDLEQTISSTETIFPKRIFSKWFSSVFFHYLFQYYQTKASTTTSSSDPHTTPSSLSLVCLSSIKKFFQSFLLWGYLFSERELLDSIITSPMTAMITTEEHQSLLQYHSQWLRMIGKLFFGKYYHDLIDYLEKITNQQLIEDELSSLLGTIGGKGGRLEIFSLPVCCHLFDFPRKKKYFQQLFLSWKESGLMTDQTANRRTAEKVAKRQGLPVQRKYRKYYETNEFQQKICLDLICRYYSSFQEYFTEALSSYIPSEKGWFPLSIVKKRLTRMYHFFSFPVHTLTSAKTPSDHLGEGEGTRQKVQKNVVDIYNVQDQLLFNGRLEIPLPWHSLPESCFEDFYQKIIQTSTLLPSSSSSPTQTMIPHLNLFELLQQVLKMNTTMEKLLFVVLEELYQYLMSLFPNGPNDSIFIEMLHLLLYVTPTACCEEYRAHRSSEENTSSNHLHPSTISSPSATHSHLYSTHSGIMTARETVGSPKTNISNHEEKSDVIGGIDAEDTWSSTPDGLLHQSIPINLELTHTLQLLQTSGQLTATVFARVVYESCPPHLLKTLHPLIAFLYQQQGQLYYYPTASSDRKDSMSYQLQEIANRPFANSTGGSAVKNVKEGLQQGFARFYQEMREVGDYYFQHYHRLHAPTTLMTFQEELSLETSVHLKGKAKAAVEGIQPSQFQENLHLYRQIVELTNGQQSSSETKEGNEAMYSPTEVNSMTLLYYYAKLCFDKKQRDLLPMKVTIQWFTFVLLRYSLGGYLTKQLVSPSLEAFEEFDENHQTSEVVHNLLDVNDGEETDFREKQIQGKLRRYYQLRLLYKTFQAIRRSAVK